MTPKGHPPDPPPDLDPTRCPGLRKKSGKQCVYTLKATETHCPNHDPKRSTVRQEAGRTRNGDLGTELGSYDGLARRTAKLIEELETGAFVVDEDTGEREFVPKLAPAIANAKRGAYRFLAELVARRLDAKWSKPAGSGAKDDAAIGKDAPNPDEPKGLEDLI
jgi:hypothetical protein